MCITTYFTFNCFKNCSSSHFRIFLKLVFSFVPSVFRKMKFSCGLATQIYARTVFPKFPISAGGITSATGAHRSFSWMWTKEDYKSKWCGALTVLSGEGASYFHESGFSTAHGVSRLMEINTSADKRLNCTELNRLRWTRFIRFMYNLNI